MDKLFVLSFLGLLIASYGVVGKKVRDDIGMLDDLEESFDIEEEDNDFNFFDIPPWKSERGGKVLVNVDSFGAAGDGISDDTQVNYYFFIFDIMFCLNVIQLFIFR